MSGFSVSARPYPIVALNGSDFPRRRLFTMAHEMAHLALNAGGLCDLHEAQDSTEAEDRIELFCNRVAAAALMPAEALAHVRDVALATADKRWTVEQLEDIAAPFGTSAESMLLRLIRLDKSIVGPLSGAQAPVRGGLRRGSRRPEGVDGRAVLLRGQGQGPRARLRSDSPGRLPRADDLIPRRGGLPGRAVRADPEA